jgi:glycosyltransferase involved in cell wall biosynthesis
MRILQVCSARTLGGGERHVAALANGLAERGHQVFAALTPRSPLSEMLTRLPPENLFTVRMRNALDIASALKLARVIREQKIDIVHAHLARDYPLASLAVRRYARLVVTRHVLFPLNRLHSLTLSKVAQVIAVSDAVANGLRKQRIVDDGRIRVIHNGIDLERFAKEPSAEARADARQLLGTGRRLLVGTVGSLLPMKGHEDFVRAAASIAASSDDVDFVIVGDDEPRNRDYRVRLERLIEELNLSRCVRLIHWTEDLARFYAALDVYVSASHTEAFGLSIVEAMASGNAVVATATEGAEEIIEDATIGMLTPTANVAALAQAIGSLLDDDERRKLMGTSARENVRDRFGLEKMIEATEGVYVGAMRSS